VTGGEAIAGNRGMKRFSDELSLQTVVEQLAHCRDDHSLGGFAGGPLPFFFACSLH
jgi:hypothetical protein